MSQQVLPLCSIDLQQPQRAFFCSDLTDYKIVERDKTAIRIRKTFIFIQYTAVTMLEYEQRSVSVATKLPSISLYRDANRAETALFVGRRKLDDVVADTVHLHAKVAFQGLEQRLRFANLEIPPNPQVP